MAVQNGFSLRHVTDGNTRRTLRKAMSYVSRDTVVGRPASVTSTLTRRTTRKASRTAGKAAGRARQSNLLRRGARAGLVARGCFYLLLGGLSARLALSGGGQQADPNGAVGTVIEQPFGMVLVAGAAAALFCFAITRLVVAVNSAMNTDDGWWPTLRAAAEAIAYGALGTFTTSFLLGNHGGGSEQSHRSLTARVMHAPAGRFAIAAVGAGIVVFYGYQLWEALTQGFEAGLDERRMPRQLRKVAAITGTAGIAARALAFAPIGVFLIVAAATYDAQNAKGLDALLRDATSHWWGLALLAMVTLGFVAFAAYSFLEAAYRKVDQA
jgi:hypothetical protein